MRIKRTISLHVIRACLTEDKQYCLSQGGTSVLHTAIDNTVAIEKVKVVPGTNCYRIEEDNGIIMGYCILQLEGVKKMISLFIRPVFRNREQEIVDAVNMFKNSALVPLL